VFSNTNFRNSFRRNGLIVLYRSHGTVVLYRSHGTVVLYRSHGTIVLYRSHGYKNCHFSCVQILDLLWFVPSNRDYFTIQIKQLWQTSFLLCPEIRRFVIPSDETWLLYGTSHTAITTFISVVSRNSIPRDSFRRIRIFVLYRPHSYNNLHFSLVHKFHLSWFLPTKYEYCTVWITRLILASFMLWHSEFQRSVICSDDSVLLYCTDHTS
jgi:hypothetical protein